jgi:hypothetical protein
MRVKTDGEFNRNFKAQHIGDTTAKMGKKESGDTRVEKGKKECGQNKGLAHVNVFLDELAHKEGQQEEHVGEGVFDFNEESWCKGAKRSRGLGNNFFTLFDVEKKMQRALSIETGSVRRASDDTWRKKDQTKPTMNNSGDSRSNRKMSEPHGRGEEALKKNCLKGGRLIKQTGVVIKNEKKWNGNGGGWRSASPTAMSLLSWNCQGLGDL